MLPKDIQTDNLNQTDINRNASADVYIYGDGGLIYKATSVTSSMPFDFDVDDILKIKIAAKDYYTYTALTDLALYQ